MDQCDHNDYGVTESSTGSHSCVLLFCEAGGPSPPRGHLVHNQETAIIGVRYLGVVKAVCDDHFDDHGARVACKELYGVPDYIKYSNGKNCEHDDFWLDNV